MCQLSVRNPTPVLGASVPETKTETPGEHTNAWTVMEGPAGNGFCVAEY
jgi:hypothetical protein